jgi:hypothetical protein
MTSSFNLHSYTFIQPHSHSCNLRRCPPGDDPKTFNENKTFEVMACMFYILHRHLLSIFFLIEYLLLLFSTCLLHNFFKSYHILNVVCVCVSLNKQDPKPHMHCYQRYLRLVISICDHRATQLQRYYTCRSREST